MDEVFRVYTSGKKITVNVCMIVAVYHLCTSVLLDVFALFEFYSTCRQRIYEYTHRQFRGHTH